MHEKNRLKFNFTLLRSAKKNHFNFKKKICLKNAYNANAQHEMLGLFGMFLIHMECHLSLIRQMNLFVTFFWDTV